MRWSAHGRYCCKSRMATPPTKQWNQNYRCSESKLRSCSLRRFNLARQDLQNTFATWSNEAAALGSPIRLASQCEKESSHGILCRTGCLDEGDARLRCRRRGRHRPGDQHCDAAGGDCCGAGAGTTLSAGGARDRPHGADALPWSRGFGRAGGLYREPAGSSGAEVARHAQDRSQRCPRAGAAGARASSNPST
jgi:hypothetical protein